ncbi:S8 family serine peptidase [Chitinophaga silvisoli]|uniref:Peptidase S8 and S53 subtilisin kexin sedolisin n=1 Tax=Chitinophaga silvisoli TaxID=2291814 RepID=A0A3E1NVE8_9BACT|nr:S8 family serine peptidase [Chitinophaga silvisoli]RFM31877.1 peptidase S8 and S53 subtilisin kexin sedolisin [Chitinophaga silvisoli]
MKKNLLPLSFPVLMLLLLASCSKDAQEVKLAQGLVKTPKQDRGFIILTEQNVDQQAISEAISSLGVKKFVFKEANKELGLIRVQTPDPTFPEKARKVAGVQSVSVDIVQNWRLPERTFRSSIPYGSTAITSGTTHDYAKTSSSAALTDRYSFLQWGLQAVHAPEAWAKGYKGGGVKVAVLDGGFLLNNPEIKPNIILTHSFVEGEEVQYHGKEGFSHGSHVAGTIAAIKDSNGVAGVAPEAKLILVKVLSDAGSGAFSSIIDGIFYATNHGAKVINMSLGGELPLKTFTDDNGTPDDPSDDYVVEYDRDVKELITAINRATLYANLNGTTVIAAAGNDGYNYDSEKRFITYPAAALGVIAISSTGPLGWGINQDTSLYLPSIFTNYGKNFIHYAAPGGNYTLPPNTTVVSVGGIINYEYLFDFVFNIGFWDEASATYYYGWSAGTSMASPHAAAVAALIYNKYPFANPLLVDLILKASSTDYGTPGKDKYFGDGEVNAAKAVR